MATIDELEDGAWAVYRWAYKAIRRVILIAFWLVEFLLGLRILLVFFGANQSTLIVDKLYWATGRMIHPFQDIFPNYDWMGHSIEFTSISAMAGFVIVAIIFLLFLRLLKFERGVTNVPPMQ